MRTDRIFPDGYTGDRVLPFLRERSFMEPLRLITSMGESQWYLVAGLCLWIVFRKRSDRPAYGGMLLFSSVALSGIAANLFKTLLGRADRASISRKASTASIFFISITPGFHSRRDMPQPLSEQLPHSRCFSLDIERRSIVRVLS